MEKLGVDEPVEEKVAEAKETGKCPQCNAVLRNQDETGVLVCPQCGTRPFEGE
jgi:predicted RNA-binding Zn-ribbon protein involved in translation (DUF1610 family)